MLEKKLVPKLRFGGFSDKWFPKILGDVCVMTSSKRVYYEDYVDLGIPFFRGKEISELKNNKKPSDILYISEDRYNDFKEKYGVPQKDDILITAVGTLGNVWKVRDNSPFYFKDGNLIWLKNIKENSDFVEKLIQISTKELIKTSIGSTQKALTMFELRKIELNFPSLPEQQKIASFLTEVDTKLSQLTKKKALLENYKKGVMQQIFNQQLRFKDGNGNDYGDWEEKKLGEISICMDNKRIPLNGFERNSKKGDVPYWGANGIVDHVNEYIFDETIVLLAEDGGYFDEFQNRPIANISHGKSWVNNHAHVIKAKQSLTTNEYLYYSLVHKNIMGYVNGGTRAKLNKSEMLQIKMIIPSSIEEQTKIANFFSELDTKIELLSTSIENTQTFKKGLLQQLFV
jgi:type I restriction enzyme S subunit